MSRPVTHWLNGLSGGELNALFRLMRESVGCSHRSQISGGSIDNLAALPANEPRSGNWYKAWVRCKIVNLTPSGGHPRWQPTVIRGGRTPTSTTAIGRQIKGALSRSRWARLKLLASSNGQVKFPCHHLAFLAKDPSKKIPDDMGSGSSMSHLCDSIGCIRGEHLELVTHHVENMDRQRCHGVTLIVALDLVLHEIPCSHAVGDTMDAKISSCCRKIRVIKIPDSSLDALLSAMQVLTAACLNTPTASQI
jgi:hypothetical protein